MQTTRFVEVKAADKFVVFRDTKGQVYSHGLGLPQKKPQRTPSVGRSHRSSARQSLLPSAIIAPVSPTKGKPEPLKRVVIKNKSREMVVAEEIHCGSEHCLVLDGTVNLIPGDQQLYGWGSCGEGELGVNNKQDINTRPIQIQIKQFFDIIDSNKSAQEQKFIPRRSGLVTALGAGREVSYFYTDNILLGSGNKFQESNPDFPLVMELAVGIQVKGVCCGPAHCGMWAYSGKAYTWGHARYGRLGHPNEIGVFADDELQVKPREVLSLGQKKVLMMAAGGKFTLFLDNTGKLSHVGLLKPFRSSYDPEMKLIAPADLQPWLSESTISTSPLVKIAAGEEHCLAADNQGKFYVWGVDRMGCLGSEIKALKEPTLIKDFESYSVVDFACGPDYSVAILDASDPDPSQKMYADFRLDSVDKVKNKLRKVKNMREASQPKSAKRTTDSKTKNMNPDQMNVQIEDFLHHSDLEGFAGLRDDSKKIVLNDLINTFLKDKLNINKFSTDYIQLTNMYERVGQNFEEIFYRQIMSDPTVQSEIRFKEPAVRASTAHRSVRALTASTQSTPSQVPQEFDVVKAALSDYFSKLSTSDMKISQKLFEKYQFDQRVEYLQKDKKIGQKMTHLKEVSSQKFLVNNRKLEFRINNVKQKKALLYNQK